MFTISCAPASARSVAGGPGCQMSSHTVGPSSASPCSQQEEIAPRREVAVLVEDPVVRKEPLPVQRLHLAAGANRTCVVEVAVEMRRTDERDDAARLSGDLAQRLLGGADEAGAKKEILGRIPVTASSGKRTMSASASLASARRARIRSRFPSRSPTVESIWARARRIGFRL